MIRAAQTIPRQQISRQPQRMRRPAAVNVARYERVLSGITGGAMTYYGLKRRSMFGLVAAGLGVMLMRRGATGHCPAYQTLGINTAHRGRAEPHDFFDHGIRVEEVVTVNRSAAELFRFWHNFENLPRFMRHLRSVRTIDQGRSHWEANAPAGTHVEWDARIINEEVPTLIAWRSLENADVDNAGSVRFVQLPSDRGTEVRVVIEYIPPGGVLGAAVAKLFGEEPSQQVREDLRRFKQIIEAGEIPTTEGQPMGTCEQ